MTKSPEAGEARPDISREIPEIDFTAIESVADAQAMVDALDALADMNEAWGQHTVKNNPPARASFVRRYGEETTGEILGSALDRFKEARQRSRQRFAVALGFSPPDEDHSLPKRTELELDDLFTSFKSVYATSPGSAWRRSNYRERLDQSISE